MTKKELIDRWHQPRGQVLLQQVVKCLKRNIPLSAVINLGIISGRYDLRGAPLSHSVAENTLTAGEYSYTKRTGSLRLKNCRLDGIDLSFADLKYAYWKKCTINNCMFEDVQAREIEFVACDFIDCIFLRSDLSYAHLAVNIGANAGAFIKTKFIKTNLSESYFYFPIIKNCLFESCNLNATNFDGSRFSDCKFSGAVKNAWFRGYSICGQKTMFWLFNKVRLGDHRNRMENIDFTEAQLRYVSFSHEVPLDSCKFPQDEEYIYIKDLNYTMPKVKEVIEAEWRGKDKEIGLKLVDIYYKDAKQGQKNYLLSSAETFKQTAELDRQFYKLIRNFN